MSQSPSLSQLQQPDAFLRRHIGPDAAEQQAMLEVLGLASRDELTRLMQVNFPELAKANTGDMKWKKFLYRQFCSREGIYVCPAPSCGECKDYAKCFGPEN